MPTLRFPSLRSFFLFALGGLVSIGSLSVSWAEGFQIGTVIPADTALTDTSGKRHTFAEFRGKPVVLEWANYQCPFTRKHYESGNMQALQKAFTARHVTWISVISSAEGKQGYLPAETAPSLVAGQGFQGTLVARDTMGALGHAFGAETTPHLFILDAEGQLVYRGAIDSIPSFDKADIAHATNYVQKALDELLSGKSVSLSQTRSYGCSIKY